MVSGSRKAIFGSFYFGILIRSRVSKNGNPSFRFLSPRSAPLSPSPVLSLTASPSPAGISLLRPPQGTKPVPKCSPIYHLQSQPSHLDRIGVWEEKLKLENPRKIAETAHIFGACRRRFRPSRPEPPTGLCSPDHHEAIATGIGRFGCRTAAN